MSIYHYSSSLSEHCHHLKMKSSIINIGTWAFIKHFDHVNLTLRFSINIGRIITTIELSNLKNK